MGGHTPPAPGRDRGGPPRRPAHHRPGAGHGGDRLHRRARPAAAGPRPAGGPAGASRAGGTPPRYRALVRWRTRAPPGGPGGTEPAAGPPGAPGLLAGRPDRGVGRQPFLAPPPGRRARPAHRDGRRRHDFLGHPPRRSRPRRREGAGRHRPPVRHPRLAGRRGNGPAGSRRRPQPALAGRGGGVGDRAGGPGADDPEHRGSGRRSRAGRSSTAKHRVRWVPALVDAERLRSLSARMPGAVAAVEQPGAGRPRSAGRCWEPRWMPSAGRGRPARHRRHRARGPLPGRGGRSRAGRPDRNPFRGRRPSRRPSWPRSWPAGRPR